MKKALVIGIDAYSDAPLNGCVNDANRIAEMLNRPNSGFEVRTLINSQATRARIRREVEWCLKDQDFSIIYFAGHGVRTNVATFLATYDYEVGDEGIDFLWLKSALTRLSRANQTCVLLLDCCHSGDASIRSLGVRAERIDRSDIPSLVGVSKVILAACKGDQVAKEDEINGQDCGLFTYHLCDALDGFASNDQQIVTISASYDYVAMKLEELGQQIPVFKGDLEGQVVFAHDVPKKGQWKPKTGSNIFSYSEANLRAENLLSQALQKATPVSHDHWQQCGYREAIQAFEPILEWFRRRIDVQPDLRTNVPFREKFDSCQRMFMNLGSVAPGVAMQQGRVGSPLGSGTFGTVFHMTGTGSVSRICFKVYHSHDLLDAQKVGRFRRGYAAMKQLDHPKIVKVIALSEIPFGFFMDYIEGANSRQFNPGASQEPESIVELLLQVAETLQHAHGRGVIHRDVKPENILIKISEQGVPSAYLSDFDLAWFSSATQVTKLAEGFGSYFYAAPEQINSPNAAVAHRTTVDTYSFGQLCFFFVSGRDPLAFNSEGNIVTIEQELARKWSDSAAATEFSRLYRECTYQTPDKRITDFRDICERLARISLAMKSSDVQYDSAAFMGEVRFTLSGEVMDVPISNNSTSFRSRSRRTEVSIMAVKDAPRVMGIDVTFRPDDIIMEGRSSHEARTKVNARVDTTLHGYTRQYDAKRSGAKSGAFEMTVRIDHLKKERAGVIVAREIIAKVLDQIERT